MHSPNVIAWAFEWLVTYSSKYYCLPQAPKPLVTMISYVIVIRVDL
jgi:hypothetical protein